MGREVRIGDDAVVDYRQGGLTYRHVADCPTVEQFVQGVYICVGII
jgi:hypothetical protein